MITSKICSICKQIKPLTKVFWHTKLDTFTSQCKECDSIRKKRKRAERQRDLFTLIGGAYCRDCGLVDDNCGFFDFHHIDEKESTGVKGVTVSRLLNSTSFDKVLEEAQRCILLCPNCHRRRHLNEGHFISRNKTKI